MNGQDDGTGATRRAHGLPGNPHLYGGPDIRPQPLGTLLVPARQTLARAVVCL